MFQKFPYDTCRRAVILNRDSKVGVEFWVATKQLEHLRQIVEQAESVPEPWGEGVDSAAVLGMEVIFESIPHRFPVLDLLDWLRDEVNAQLPVTVVEAALIELAKLYALKPDPLEGMKVE